MFQRIVKFCDEMIASEWRPCNARPKHDDMQGCLVIGRWYDQQKTWAILYVGQGCIRDLLESRFRASRKWSIGMYLSSFPKKALRKLIWIKWHKDPYYPREVWYIERNIIKSSLFDTRQLYFMQYNTTVFDIVLLQNSEVFICSCFSPIIQSFYVLITS